MWIAAARAASATIIGSALLLGGPAWAASEQGVAIFEAKCAACHENGGNVLQRGKTLFPEALQANGYATEPEIIKLLVNGKGQMPKYQGAIPPVSKLTDEEIAEVANYVLERADERWK